MRGGWGLVLILRERLVTGVAGRDSLGKVGVVEGWLGWFSVVTR